MNKWPYELGTYSPFEVQKYCVEDPEWQKHRLKMKGVSTSMKLLMLEEWRTYRSRGRQTEVQVDNYLNALKRGGQLDMSLNVQR